MLHVLAGTALLLGVENIYDFSTEKNPFVGDEK